MKAYLFSFLCVSFWAGNFIIGRYLKDDFSPIELNTIRWFIVFVIIFPYFLLKSKKIVPLLLKNIKIMLVLSLLSVTLFNAILYEGLSETFSNNALIINLSVPIYILILSYFVLKQSIHIEQIVGICISIIGVLFIILKGQISNVQTLEFNSGDLWVVLSSFIWAFYSVLIKFKPKELNDFEYFSSIVVMGFFFSICAYFFFGYSIIQGISLFKNHTYPLLYIALFSSILSYYFWHYSIEKIGATKTSQFTYLMPLLGALFAYILLDESLEIYHLFGMISIGLGIYLSLFFRVAQ